MSRAASLAWTILRNDLRMFWRVGSNAKLRWAASGFGRALIIALLHMPALSVVASFSRHEDTTGGPQFACLFAALFVLMMALQRSLEVLYNRGDLPFLLASPVPERVVLHTRLIDVAFTTVLGTATLVVPLVNAGWILVDARFAWGFLAWILATLVIAPFSLFLTLTTVEKIGARRARAGIQIFGLVFAIAAMLSMQLPTWMADRTIPGAREAAQGAFLTLFAVPPLTWLAAAARGDPRWLLGLASLGVVAFFVAQHALARAFTKGAQSTAGDVGGTTRRRPGAAHAAWRRAFVGARGQRVLRKELRVLGRDPLLIARCSMQLAALLPMLIGTMVVRQTVGIAAFAFLAPSMITVTLAALMNANDDAHEFVAASPLSRREAVLARAVAAAVPTTVLGVVMAMVMLWQGKPSLAALVVVGAALLSLALGWLSTCTTPVLSAEDRARQKAPRLFGQSIVGMVIGGLATGGIGAIDGGAGLVGAVLFAVALAIAALLFLVRPRSAWAES